ncbi:hypothetical protein KI387_040148, partial [Taxus chinensis]
AQRGPRGDLGWIVVTLSVPITVRCVVQARREAGTPKAPLLHIRAALAYYREEDELIDLDSDSEEDAGDDMKG